MRHVPDGTLRRFLDEPFAVPDGEAAHAWTCERCTTRGAHIARDAAAVTALLGRPQPVPDLDLAWSRLQGASMASPRSQPESRWLRRPVLSRWRLITLRVPPPAVLASVAAVLAVVAAAVTVTTVLAPSNRAPTVMSPPAIKALEDVAGIDSAGILGGFQKTSGSLSLPFGVVDWSSAGASRQVASVGAAEKATGIDLPVPSLLPAGVGSPTTIVVQPQVVATVRLDQAAGSLAGQSLSVTAGPAVLVEYGAATSAIGLPALVTFAMGRPLLSPTGTKTAQLEAYLLSRPGLPAGLAQEIRLLGGIGTVVPVVGSPGADLSQVDVGGSPGILIADASVGVSGVLWVSRNDIVHAAVGLLDSHDILNVAGQLG